VVDAIVDAPTPTRCCRPLHGPWLLVERGSGAHRLRDAAHCHSETIVAAAVASDGDKARDMR